MPILGATVLCMPMRDSPILIYAKTSVWSYAMFSFLLRKAGVWFARKQQSHEGSERVQNEEVHIVGDLNVVLKQLKEEVQDSNDIVIRRFRLGGSQGRECALVFVDGLSESRTVNEDIIRPLMRANIKLEEDSATEIIARIMHQHVYVNEIGVLHTMSEAFGSALFGDAVLFIDGVPCALSLNARGWEMRSVSEPASEAVIRGPRESFIENMRTNTSLIRRKIKNPALIFESFTIGRKTRTSVCIAYLRNVCKPELVKEVKKRLRAIDTDSILESGYIEQYIQDQPGSIFATVGYTEKPDVAAAKILEGRVAIIVDGTPFVLTVPFVFLESFQAPEDYYLKFYFATFVRIIRIIGYFITILAPAFYVTITTFHHELIPTSLLIAMAKAREGVPFPAFVECLLMIVVFEIIREAGIRLPRPVGQALSIVGALVIGESAVSAGLIGAPMVIVIAITAISGFLVPTQNDAAIILRLILLLLAACFGGFGIALGLYAILVHMSALESFGYPFLSPSVPFDLEDQKDSVVLLPNWMQVSRPKGMATDQQRKVYNVPPVGVDKSDDN